MAVNVSSMTVNEFVLFMDEQQNEERAFKTKILTWYEQVVDRTYDFFSDTLQGRSWLGLFIAFGSCVWGSLVLVCASGFRGCCFWFVGHFFFSVSVSWLRKASVYTLPEKITLPGRFSL